MRGLSYFFSSEYKNENIPLYRSYGVWRKTHPVLDKILFYALRSLVIFVLAVLGTAFFATTVTLLLYADILVATVFVLIVFSIIFFVLTRSMRKRIKLLRKLRRLCKKEGYRLIKGRSFFRSFRWNTKEHDFILKTDKYEYYVHFLTIGKYTSTLTFKDPEHIEKVVYPLNNNFSLIFEFRPKRSTLNTDFPPLPTDMSTYHIRIILINPVCREMFEKTPDGCIVATGNGMSRFGYTVFSGSSFIEAVKRNETQNTNN